MFFKKSEKISSLCVEERLPNLPIAYKAPLQICSAPAQQSCRFTAQKGLG